MHRISNPSCLMWGLLLALGLHAVTSQSFAQPPAGADEDKTPIVKIPIDQPALIMTTTRKAIKEAKIDNPRIAKVEATDNPFVVRVTGMSSGRTHLILQPAEGPVEIRIIQVMDTDEELFSVDARSWKNGGRSCCS